MVEYPGHAPSHVCLFNRQPLLSAATISCERPVLHFDFGFSPDPVGEYLSSLDRTAALDPELCLPGHGPPFHEVLRPPRPRRAEVAQRLGRVESALHPSPMTAFELASQRHGELVLGSGGSHFLAEALALLGRSRSRETASSASGKAASTGGESDHITESLDPID